MLAYKPQFGLLIPLVLIASGRWRVFAAAAAAVALLTLAVTLAFGIDVWTAFFASTKFTRTVVLEQGGTGWFKIQSVFPGCACGAAASRSLTRRKARSRC